jgi:hypothetical protein
LRRAHRGAFDRQSVGIAPLIRQWYLPIYHSMRAAPASHQPALFARITVAPHLGVLSCG